MLKSTFTLLAIMVFATVSAAPSGITPDYKISSAADDPAEIKWLSPDEALAQHAETGKKILFYVYTPTCGFCQRTAAEVMVDPNVIETMNELYLPVRINAGSRETLQMNGESLTHRQIATRLGTEYVPFYVVMEKDEIIGSRSGFHSSDQLTALLVFYADDHYKQLSFEDFLRTW
ncbi:MAG: thioredoxin family protein [Rhodothermaceae bacterium]|nr:thioredoxin family protein [Rhodothermaceae bacterium]